MPSVHATFEATAARTPQAEFLCVEPTTAQAYGLAAGSLGWGEAARRVHELARAYARAGYGHGHRVGLLLQNRPDFLLHWLALNALGASVVPISHELRAADLEYLVGHSEIALAVTLPERAADLHEAARGWLDVAVRGRAGDAALEERQKRLRGVLEIHNTLLGTREAIEMP